MESSGLEVITYGRSKVPQKISGEIEKILKKAGKHNEIENETITVILLNKVPIAAAESHSETTPKGKVTFATRIGRREDAYELLADAKIIIPHTLGEELIHHMHAENNEIVIKNFSNSGLRLAGRLYKIREREHDTFRLPTGSKPYIPRRP